MTIVEELDLYGHKQLVILGPLTSDDERAIRGSSIRRAQIRGFGQRPLPDLSILADFDEVEVVTLNVTSDAAVQSLSGLKVLGLETYAQNAIDFRRFPLLERLHLNWRPEAETAFANRSIRNLSVSGYPFPDLRALGALSSLQGIRVANSGQLRTLTGVAELGT